MALAAVALFLISACALGSRLVDDELLATLLGAGDLHGPDALARLPVNYPAVWAGILLAPVALDLRGVVAAAAPLGARASFLQTLGPPAERPPWRCWSFVLGAHWLVALKPETSADGLAMHLAIPANIAAHHAMTFQPGRILWAVMPMGADLAYSIVYLLGGESAAHLLDFAMLLAVAGLLYAAVRRWVQPGDGLAAGGAVRRVPAGATGHRIALRGEYPGGHGVGDADGGLALRRHRQAAASSTRRRCWAARRWPPSSPRFPFVALALPFAAWRRAGTGKHGTGALPLAVVLLLATALPTYAIAWFQDGQPGVSVSQPVDSIAVAGPRCGCADVRFRQPLTWQTPFDLTFHTSRFYEGQNGSLGFQYLFWRRWRWWRCWRRAAGPVLCAPSSRLPPHGRAAHRTQRALSLRCLPLMFPLRRAARLAAGTRPVLHASLMAAAVVCTGMNICFLPASGWYHKDFYAHYAFRRDGFERFLEEEAPGRAPW